MFIIEKLTVHTSEDK